MSPYSHNNQDLLMPYSEWTFKIRVPHIIMKSAKPWRAQNESRSYLTETARKARKLCLKRFLASLCMEQCIFMHIVGVMIPFGTK